MSLYCIALVTNTTHMLQIQFTKLYGPRRRAARRTLGHDRRRWGAGRGIEREVTLAVNIGVYAAFGVREVWVIDAKRATTWAHRRLGAEGYGEILEAPANELLTPMLAGELAARLSDLGISPVLGE
jgi:hypothetical protein